jgi:hypothetical protein
LHSSLRDWDAELQQLAANALGSPETVVIGHSTNQGDGLRGDARLTSPSSTTSPSPEESESFAVPAQDGLRFHQQ